MGEGLLFLTDFANEEEYRLSRSSLVDDHEQEGWSLGMINLLSEVVPDRTAVGRLSDGFKAGLDEKVFSSTPRDDGKTSRNDAATPRFDVQEFGNDIKRDENKGKKAEIYQRNDQNHETLTETIDETNETNTENNEKNDENNICDPENRTNYKSSKYDARIRQDPHTEARSKEGKLRQTEKSGVRDYTVDEGSEKSGMHSSQRREEEIDNFNEEQNGEKNSKNYDKTNEGKKEICLNEGNIFERDLRQKLRIDVSKTYQCRGEHKFEGNNVEDVTRGHGSSTERGHKTSVSAGDLRGSWTERSTRQEEPLKYPKIILKAPSSNLGTKENQKSGEKTPLYGGTAYMRNKLGSWITPRNTTDANFGNRIPTQEDLWEVLKPAIRRGVPDSLKKKVFLLSNDGAPFLKSHPNFYENALKSTFGPNIPEKMRGKSPTFCGGLLGMHEDITGASWNVAGESIGERRSISENPVYGSEFLANSAVDLLRSVFPCSPSISPRSAGERKLSNLILRSKNGDSASDLDCRTVSGSGNLLGIETPRQRMLSERKNRDESYSIFEIGDKKMQKKKSEEKHFLFKLPKMFASPASVWKKQHKKQTAAVPLTFLSENVIKEQDPVKQKNSFASFLFQKKNIPPKNIPPKNIPPDLKNPPKSPPTDDPPDFRTYSNAHHERAYERPSSSVAPSESTNEENLPRSPSVSSEVTSEFGIARNKKADVYQLEDVTDFYAILKEDGKDAVRRILWVINGLYGSDVEFCPLIPNTVCILLLYMSEVEAFTVLRNLVGESVRRRRLSDSRSNLHPFMFYRRKDFIQFVKIVISGVHRRLNRLYRHLRGLEVDLLAWAARALQDGFARTLPLDFFLRIFTSFLFEGSKTLYRYLLAILKMNEGELLLCQSQRQAELILYDLTTSMDLDALTKLAYRFTIHHKKHYRSKFASQYPSPYLLNVQIEQFYRPKLNTPSQIFDVEQLQTFWAWLPNSATILDPVMTYRSSTDGMSLTSLERKMENEERPMLFVLRTTGDEIIGGFSPFPFSFSPRNSNEFYGDAFVFTLSPEEAVYWWTGKNQSFIDCNRSRILIGGEDIAIFIDAEVRQGRCRPSASFDCPALVRRTEDSLGFFTISLLEIWLLK